MGLVTAGSVGQWYARLARKHTIDCHPGQKEPHRHEQIVDCLHLLTQNGTFNEHEAGQQRYSFRMSLTRTFLGSHEYELRTRGSREVLPVF
jgi:hypothetical protein